MDCLVTKLKGAVDDSSLMHIGEFRIGISQVESPSSKTQSFNFIFTKDARLEIIGDGYFTDKALTANKGKTLDIVANTPTDVYVSTGNLEIAILDKYSLDRVIFGNNAEVVTSNQMNNRSMNINDLKYSTRLKNINVSSNKVTGDLSSIKNLTKLVDLSIANSQVFGDLSNIKNLTKLSLLYINNTKISGNISAISNLVNLTIINMIDATQLSGDLSSLSGLTKLEGLSIYNTPQISGDISALKNATKLRTIALDNTHGDLSSLIGITGLGYCSLKKSTITGDLAKLADACYFTSFQYNNGSSLTWTTRPSTANIMAIEGNPKIDNVDKMLQDQAQCVKAIPSSGEIWYSVISATGTRTSASDAAVSTLQEKGYTVSIKNE